MTTDEAEAYLAQDFSDRLADAEIVETEPGPHPMGLVRLSSPLLEQLDRIAIAKGRPRETLIQRVLWEFVHQQETDEAAPPRERGPVPSS